MSVDDALLEFQQATRDDVATLLMRASRAVNEATLAELDPAGESGVRLAHVPVIAALEAGGSRLVDLASRVGVTRQATAALVRDLERAGIVTTRPDHDDRRATRVFLTEAGAAFCRRAVAYVRAREASIAREIGEADIATVRAVLGRLAEG